MSEGLGQTGAGEPITEELLEQLTAQAEEGFDVEEILRRRGSVSAMAVGRGGGNLAPELNSGEG